jgi:hypothetical protein
LAAIARKALRKTGEWAHESYEVMRKDLVGVADAADKRTRRRL